MTRISVFLFLSFLGTVGFAQPFTVSPSPVANLVIPEGGYEEASIYFTNQTNADLTLNWTLTSNTLDPVWPVAMTDNNTSRPGAYLGSTMVPIPPLDSGFLKFSCGINIGDYGSGSLKYNIWVVDDPSTTIEVTYNVNGAVSVAPSYATSLTIAPNPARNSINLCTENSKLENGLAQIYDLSGRLLQEVTVRRADALEIKVHDLPEGVYLLRYTTKKGIITRSFLKSN